EPADEVWRRLNYELKIIIDMDLAAYFLIVQDIIAFAKKEGIPVGPGRGSGVGSLVAYALGITEINPLEFGLLFERFLNPERKGMPDIDIDLCHRGRPRVLEYVRQKYGRDHVAHLGAFVTLRPRAVVRDVGRALGIAYEKTDRMAKAVPYFAQSIEAALTESAGLYAISEDSEARTILEYGRALEGLPRHMTQHAAGIVVTREPITNYLALQRAGGEEIITQAEMETVEELGLLKIDLLGLRYLTVIRDTLDFLKSQGIALTEEAIPCDDPQVYKAIGRGDTVGSFQLESGGMRRLLRQYKPENFADIIAILALYRPGPINSGMVDTFIKRRHGKEPVRYLHPSLEPVLKETYGVILYQEQVMEVARVLAGYTLGQADLLRRAVSKRDPGALTRERSVFIERACGRGVASETATAVFDLIQEFGHYGFAKAHSAAYALNAYRTVYLKVHFPVAYHAALLSLNWGVEDRFPRYLAETRRKGISLLLPDINRSASLFVPEQNYIRTGLVMVRDLGQKGIQALIDARKPSQFSCLKDILDRTDRKQLTRRAMENLVRVGACDAFGISRPQLLFNLQSLLRKTSSRSNPAQGQLCFDDIVGEPRHDAFLTDYSAEVQWELERELLGYYVTRHPLEIFERYLTGLKLDDTESLREEEKEHVLLCGLIGGLRSHRTRKGERMLFGVLEDLTGLADLVIFPRVLGRFGQLLMEKEPLLVWGKTDTSDEQTTVVVEGIRRIRGENNRNETGDLKSIES
ncbi:MAG TPA: DNA polymerase III subunit alpha, partial [Bacillota bacterium]|nr:DNA polymerase III subunit alpha [Bacillota bacterium]